MGIFNGVTKFVGLSSEMDLPPQRYRLLADGLAVSDRRAQAWFLIDPASVQRASSEDRKDEVLSLIAQTQKIIGDHKSQVEVLWGRLTAEGYTPGYMLEDGSLTPWAEDRAVSIDSWDLPERYVLLGVDIEDRKNGQVSQALRNATAWVGEDQRAIPDQEFEFLTRQVNSLENRLRETRWMLRRAPVEMVAWLVARQNHRGLELGRDGVVTGPRLARLVRGRSYPWPDHMRHYDSSGHESTYSAHLVITDLPFEMQVPGNGEWLLTLSDIDRMGLPGEPERVRVLTEAHVRFEYMSQAAALKVVDKVVRSAREQEISARESVAGEPGQDVLDAKAAAIEVAADIRQGRDQIVQLFPVLSITEYSLEALQAATAAVIDHYAEMGITVDVATDQQREAWLSEWPCDEARIKDLEHITNARGFFGSWFWGGSVAGEKEGPVIGYTTGSTMMPVRLHPTEAPRRGGKGDSATYAFLGRSARGKTTAMQLCVLDAADEGAWVFLPDLKGDLGGIVKAAHEYGVPAEVSTVSKDFAGMADLLALSDREEAQSAAHGQLMLLVSDSFKMAASPVLMKEISYLLKEDRDCTTARLIERMEASPNKISRDLASELRAWETDVYGAAIVGRRTNKVPLSAAPGIHLVRFPGMTPPSIDTPIEHWTTTERVQAAVLRGLLAWARQTISKDDLRDLRKMICVPEAHMLTASGEGAAFLNQMCRMVRALGGCVLLDTQDTESIARHTGIMEQIVGVFAFSQQTKPQQSALVELLGLEVTEENMKAVKNVSVDPTGEVWHGHCLMKDYTGRVATVQVAIPNERVAELLSTNPGKAKVTV